MNQKILVVDDEPNNLQVLRQILKDHYQLIFAHNGEKALEVTAKHLPDLVLLDIMMPGMGGYEVCKKLKATALTAEIPVIFVSAMSEVADETRGFDVGAVDYIQKPVSAPIVLRRVQIHLSLVRVHALRNSEARMKAIFESAVEGIIIMNEEGIIELVNPAATRLFHYTVEEMVGHNVSMIIPSPHKELHDGYLKRYIDTKEARIVGVGREVEGMRKDGSTIPLELSVSDVALANRRVFTGMLHDLTVRKEADRLKNEFVSTVSHELRTPLTSIYGGLKLVLAGITGELPKKARKMLELAYNNSERLNLLINDILDIQKMESGRMEYHFQTLDAMALVLKAVEDNRGYADKFGVYFTLTKSVLEKTFVRGDESRLCQVLANMLSNAAKFSESGDSVEVWVERWEGWVRFSVIDHGPGIPEAFQPRVFNKFAQADSSDTRQKGGTGLGLSIAKALVESHHGEIGFRTKSGEGTAFFFQLPEILEERSGPQAKQSEAESNE